MVLFEVNQLTEFRVEIGIVLAEGTSKASFLQSKHFSMDQAFVDSSTYLGVENAFTSNVSTLEVHVSSNSIMRQRART